MNGWRSILPSRYVRPLASTVCGVCLVAECLAQAGPKEGVVVRPLDRLEIQVRREPQLSDNYKVSPSGTIDFPMVGEVQVTGLRPEEVAAKIEERLGTYIRRPDVEARIVRGEKAEPIVAEPPRAQGGYSVYLSGAVREPGAYYVNEPVTALQLIVRAGGMDNVFDPSHVPGSSSEGSARILPDLKRVSIVSDQGEVETLDLSGMGQKDLELEPLSPGDTVIVPGHTRGSFAIYGWVGRPGVYRLNQPILLTEALARGVPDERFADLTRVKIIRGDPKNPEAFTVNLDRLVARKEVELLPVVRPGDTVYVPRNLFSRLPFVSWIAPPARAWPSTSD